MDTFIDLLLAFAAVTAGLLAAAMMAGALIVAILEHLPSRRPEGER